MFKPPQEIATEVFARLPNALRLPQRHSHWAAQRLGNGSIDAFLEGPAFDRAGRLHLVDTAHGRILRVTTDGEFEIIAEYPGMPNGICIHRDGRLYIADYQHGILVLDAASGQIETLCGEHAEGRFLGVNDLCFDAAGNLYFTDQGDSDLRTPNGSVFRLSADGQLQCSLGGLASPNGLAISADGRALLLAVTRDNAVWRLPLNSDGSLGRVGRFIQLSGAPGGGPDGLALDMAGNLAVAHINMGSVWVFDAWGEPLYRLKSCAGRGTSNLAYGDAEQRMLYIVESQSSTILQARMPQPGLTLYSHSQATG